MNAQRERALSIANGAHAKRRQIKYGLPKLGRKRAALRAAALIQKPPSELEKLIAYEFIQWVPGIGVTYARRLLKSAAINEPWATIGELDGAERASIALGLRGFAARSSVDRRPRTRLGEAEGIPFRQDGPKCRKCGEWLSTRRRGTVCGFCQEQETAA